MTDHTRANGSHHRDEHGIFNGIPVGEEKLLAYGVVPKRGPGRISVLVELVGERPFPTSPAYYTIIAYRTDRGATVRGIECPPREIKQTDDVAEIRRCWSEITGHELGDATMEGRL